jgi:Ca2+ transporting ATPase
MFIVFLGGVVIADPALTSVQMLWVNLIMDTLAALALATEPPSEELLNDKPYSRNEKIVTPVMWRNITGQALYQIAVLVVLLFLGPTIFDIGYPEGTEFFVAAGVVNGQAEIYAINKTIHYTLIFQTFVMMQVFNEINSRKLGSHDFNVFKGFFNNLLFLAILVATIVV